MESRSTVERDELGIQFKETSIKFHAETKSSFAKKNQNYENSRRNYCKIMKIELWACSLTYEGRSKRNKYYPKSC
jgi:hypothetical protein